MLDFINTPIVDHGSLAIDLLYGFGLAGFVSLVMYFLIFVSEEFKK